MRTRWMLLTAAGLALAVGPGPEHAFGQPGLPPVPPLPTDGPADPPTTIGDAPTEATQPPTVTPVAPPVVPFVAPPVEKLTPPGDAPVVIDADPSPQVLPAAPTHHEPERPAIVRPRYGSVMTNGAYMPVPVPARPAATAYWQPGGPEGRAGSPFYWSAPGQDGPLYVVHGMRGVPWGYDHSVYGYHFGPGYYRDGEAGHYRFPYYTYRAPWYSPGPPIYNRFTNLPW